MKKKATPPNAVTPDTTPKARTPHFTGFAFNHADQHPYKAMGLTEKQTKPLFDEVNNHIKESKSASELAERLTSLTKEEVIVSMIGMMMSHRH